MEGQQFNPHNLNLVTDPEHPKKPKKRVKKESEWTRNKAKQARVQGRELRDAAGEIVVKGRRMLDVDCNCGCSAKLSAEEKEFTFEQFRGKKTHSIQNEYLRGCTYVSGVKMFENGHFRREFTHVLRFDFRTVEVCQKFFLGIHGIDRSRLRTQVLCQEVDIDDKRGKHSNHRVVTTDQVRDKMRIYFAALPARESHYSMHDNPHRRYMDSDVTVTSLFDGFFKAFPEISRAEAKMPVFREIFNTEFNITFGNPRTDKCATCELAITSIHNAKIQDPENLELIDQLEQNQICHLETAQVFYNDYESAASLPNDTVAICFDFQKNFPLPSTQVNKEYYISQLWICNFGIKNLKTGESTMFVYSEHFAKKGANEVITCLMYYIQEVIPPEVKQLYIFCDNTYGQNKNRFVFAALQNLANNRFENVYLKYPVPGHSRMPIDSDFGRITIKKSNLEKVSYPSDITGIISNAQKEKPFKIVYVNNNLTDDLCDDGHVVLDVKDYKRALAKLLLPSHRANLNLQTAREFHFRQNETVVVNYSERFLDPKRVLQLLVPNVAPGDLAAKIQTAPSAYGDYLPISNIKLRNVEELTKYIVSKPGLIFYNTLYSITDGVRRYYNA